MNKPMSGQYKTKNGMNRGRLDNRAQSLITINAKLLTTSVGKQSKLYIDSKNYRHEIYAEITTNTAQYWHQVVLEREPKYHF